MRPGPPKKVLIIKPSSLGDVVQAMPVLRLLKAHLPQSTVHWWIDDKLSGLLEGDPDIDRLILFRRTRWAAPGKLRHLFSDILWMRRQQYDLVLDLQSLARSGLIAWLANGAFTIGLDDRREGAPCLYDLAVPRRGHNEHAVDWYKHVVATLGMGIVPFDWLPERAGASSQIRARWPVDAHPWVVLQPGARWLNKRWPAANFGQAAKLISTQDPGIHFAILGSADDKPLASQICQALPDRCLDLTGELTLPEMIEWLRACACMITNDTGPMHVAAALGKPVAAIFGPTTPARTGPYGQINHALQASLPCVPCMKKTCSNRAESLACMHAISPAAVAHALRPHLPH